MLKHILAAMVILIAFNLPANTLALPHDATPIQTALDTLPFQITHSNVTISIELIGFSNLTLRVDRLAAYLPKTMSPILQQSGLSYGVIFGARYQVTDLGEEANASLRNYLASDITVMNPPAFLQQQLGPDQSKYAIASANDLESWLQAHSNQFGITQTQYTILVANLTGVSKYDHYYAASYPELDQNFRSARYSASNAYFPVVNWMISWGGVNRFYYIDLSAGSRDTSHDYSFHNPAHVPIQYFFTSYRRATNDTMTEYVADYITEVVRNIVFPDYSAFPPFSGNYNVNIFLFDDTGRIFETSYSQFLNATLIKYALQKLIPYANFTVAAQFAQLDTNRALHQRFQHSRITTFNKVGFGYSALTVNYYDARSIYSYLQDNLNVYAPQSPGTVTIPVFCFAVMGASRIVDPYQESIPLLAPNDPDNEPMSASVTVFPGAAIVSVSERQLFDWGLGMSHAVIQAAGNVMGLEVRNVRSTADAQPSVMSLQTYAFGFSQFEVDSLLRGHADYLLSLVRAQLNVIQSIAGDNAATYMLSNASIAVNYGLKSYSNLDFATAIGYFEYSYTTIDQLFQQHVEWLTEQMDELDGGTVFTSIEALRIGRNELAKAVSARNSGDLAGSFVALAHASVALSLAEIAEEAYAASSMTYVLTGLLVGLVVGFGVDRLIVRLNKRRGRGEAGGL